MKAIVYTEYGPPEVLHVKEVGKPTPREDEVLVKVFASAVNRTDCATVRAKPFFMRIATGLLRPKKQTPGSEFAGEIEAVGKSISSFAVGDAIFGFNDDGAGAQAEYMTTTEDKIVIKPEQLSYEQAAASSEGAHYAYNFINKVNLEAGQHALVNGATGAIGSAAVQLLKHFDIHVTAVCEGRNTDLVKSLGAERVIDYTSEDFTNDESKYELVFDTVGKSSFFKCKHLLNPGGVYISSELGYMAQNIYLPFITSLLGGRKTKFPFPVNIKRTLELVKSLVEQDEFQAVVDRTYPLEQIAKAYTYVEQGQKIGSVVITLRPDSDT